MRGVWAVALVAGLAAQAASGQAPGISGGAADPGDPAAVARALFHGDADSGVRAGVAGMAPVLPARRFPCANCHGADGMGGTEGARDVPPIVATGRQPPLDASVILAALVGGRGRDGQPLDPLMPRYDLSPPQAEALAAFLAALPTQETRGIGPGTVVLRVAPPDAALPLARAFEAGFAQALGGRRAWGRQVILAPHDRPALAALGFAAADGADPGLPLLAPLGPSLPGPAPVLSLCASFEAEIRALLAALPPGAPVRVLGQGPLAEAARAAAQGAGHAATSAADAPTLLLDRAGGRLDEIAPGAPVMGIAAQLAGPPLARLRASGRSLRLSDGCGGLPDMGGLSDGGGEGRAHRLGVLAGDAVWQALVEAGRGLTRTRFLKALERVRPGLSVAGAPPVVTEHRNGS